MLNLMKNKDGSYAMSIQNYQVGDTIQFSDEIQKIEYSSENNESNIFFISSKDEEDYLKFKGNLTTDLSIGEPLTLNIPVESLDSNDELKMPAYYKYLMDNNNYAPELSMFQ